MVRLSDFLLYLGVFIAAAIPALEVWIAVPAGVLAGLPLIPTAIFGFLGNVSTLLPVVYAGDKIRDWFRKRSKNPSEPEKARQSEGGNQGQSEQSEPEQPGKLDERISRKRSRTQRIAERFGVPGLALLGPFVIGVHAAAAFAMATGASRRQTLGWFMASIALCSLLFAILAQMGLATFAEETSLPFID